MSEYAVLLNETTLGVVEINDSIIPDEFFKHLEDVKVFPDRHEKDEYLKKSLGFDDMFDFRAEHGIKEGRIYHRSPKPRKKQ